MMNAELISKEHFQGVRAYSCNDPEVRAALKKFELGELSWSEAYAVFEALENTRAEVHGVILEARVIQIDTDVVSEEQIAEIVARCQPVIIRYSSHERRGRNGCGENAIR